MKESQAPGQTDAAATFSIKLFVILEEPRENAATPVVCFSHLRWSFVYQRPQHLLRRAAGLTEVHFWEEPLLENREDARLATTINSEGVHVLTPLLPVSLAPEAAVQAERRLLDAYMAEQQMARYVGWYYTPMALRVSSHLKPAVTVYDCMDELSAFQGAPPELLEQEKRLFARADAVFAGGESLFSVKRLQHANVHLFPSSIDQDHFFSARMALDDPKDQALIPHPRVGFYGVLDERLDRELVREVAALLPEWHFVLIGPVVKINADELPRAKNIHYLGQKQYSELPQYLSGWDVAMLPFARNASTRFISPTKTPEYLAAGKPVVSTPIQDVVRPYGELGLVHIAADARSFAAAIEESLKQTGETWLGRVDRFLAGNSWDRTFGGMWKEIQRCSSPLGPESSAVDLLRQERSGANV